MPTAVDNTWVVCWPAEVLAAALAAAHPAYAAKLVDRWRRDENEVDDDDIDKLDEDELEADTGEVKKSEYSCGSHADARGPLTYA